MRKIKILFVCHGNICRSPMAEMTLKHLANQQNRTAEFYINSAATSREEIGSTIHHGTRQKLAEVGVPYGDHRAVQLTKEDYDQYDYLIGMDDENIRNMQRICGGDPEGKMYLLLSFAGKHRSIADPWYTGNFDDTYRDVLEGCTAFLNQI